VSPLHVRHPFLGDEPPDVADCDAEVIGELLDREEMGKGICHRHGCSFGERFCPSLPDGSSLEREFRSTNGVDRAGEVLAEL
jgi:hypothetical protein